MQSSQLLMRKRVECLFSVPSDRPAATDQWAVTAVSFLWLWPIVEIVPQIRLYVSCESRVWYFQLVFVTCMALLLVNIHWDLATRNSHLKPGEARPSTKNISCLTQKCIFWRRQLTDFLTKIFVRWDQLNVGYRKAYAISRAAESESRPESESVRINRFG